ncbi:MAG: hypothetical protein OQK05_04735 [Pseudopelagicola sp.]|nr:hypothetical protein [Pseudopelagicola sp.]
MIDPADIQHKNAALAALAAKTFSFEAKGLRHAMRKVGRRLPVKMHAHAKTLLDAESKAGHPKIRMQIKAETVEKAYTELRSALEALDPGDMRKGVILSTLGMVSFHLIAVFTVLIVVLVWRGFL